MEYKTLVVDDTSYKAVETIKKEVAEGWAVYQMYWCLDKDSRNNVIITFVKSNPHQ